MLESLYEKMIERKDQIQEEFDSLHEDINPEEIDRLFKPHTFEKTIQDKTFISTDGSHNSKKYLDGILYAVGAVTLLSRPDESIIPESEEADVRTYTATNLEGFNQYISTYMEILELKNTLKSLKNNENTIDYILIDGSLRGQLHHFNVNNELNQQIKTILLGIIKKFEKKLDDNSFDVELDYYNNIGYIKQQVIQKAKESNDEELSNFKYENFEEEIQNYYTGLELLACITHLINNYSEKIVCISKTSRTNKLFDEKIPDSAVLEYFTTESGYTIPAVTDNKKLVRPLNQNRFTSLEYPLYNDKILNYHYITLFARLENKKHVIKIEIPLKNKDNVNKILDNIVNILDDLYSCSINGYPYILKKVHDNVVITNKFMDRMEMVYELKNKPKGREVLSY
ncbi:DNA double-strand break repair nuclease NurA [Methanosphaera sp. BMS]|uniref:DNA double-strand break repair nuclease NurA n=1 Tax=Methanosphaera sp. BMS TaxID=1789762 RepID=UPI0013A6A9D0|nr:DNA double-strand break repair nuclease NurA [Methanosphaera sp. BMS]